MSLDTIFGGVVFLVMVILSIARKIQEQRELNNPKNNEPVLRREDLPPEARRRLYGEETIREARPKGAGPVSAPAAPHFPPQEERSLEVDEEEEEAEWEPVHQPQSRQELSRPTVVVTQAPARPAPRPPVPPPIPRPAQRPTVTMERIPQAPQPRTAVTDDDRQREAERRRVMELQRMQQLLAAKNKASVAAGQVPPPASSSRRRRSVLGHGADLRRAIIVSEVLGRPKSMQ